MTLKKTLTSSGKEKYSINILHKINHHRLQSTEQKHTGICKQTVPIALFLSKHKISFPFCISHGSRLLMVSVVLHFCGSQEEENSHSKSLTWPGHHIICTRRAWKVSRRSVVMEATGSSSVHWTQLQPRPELSCYCLLNELYAESQPEAFGIISKSYFFKFLISGVWPCLWDFMLDATRKF